MKNKVVLLEVETMYLGASAYLQILMHEGDVFVDESMATEAEEFILEYIQIYHRADRLTFNAAVKNLHVFNNNRTPSISRDVLQLSRLAITRAFHPGGLDGDLDIH